MKTPIVFIHGLWLHSDSWKSWEVFFKDNGYETFAPGWPGEAATVEETRAVPGIVAGFGIDDVVAHYASFIQSLPTKPILIGHSFGGLIVQKLLGMDMACAGIAIDAAPIKGVLALPFSALKVASVALKNPGNWNRAVSLTASEFHYGFTNTLSPEESSELFKRWTIPSTAKPLFQATLANFVPNSAAKVNVRNQDRGPLLLIAGGKDHTVPAAITRSTLKLYRKSQAITEYKEFNDRDHSLAINSQWKEIAEYSLSWLNEHSL
ncbi:alpha/beta fold hydrolase [soil metagenome]